MNIKKVKATYNLERMLTSTSQPSRAGKLACAHVIASRKEEKSAYP